MQLPVYVTTYSLEVDFIFILHFAFAKNKIKENELFPPTNIREYTYDGKMWIATSPPTMDCEMALHYWVMVMIFLVPINYSS